MAFEKKMLKKLFGVKKTKKVRSSVNVRSISVEVSDERVCCPKRGRGRPSKNSMVDQWFFWEKVVFLYKLIMNSTLLPITSIHLYMSYISLLYTIPFACTLACFFFNFYFQKKKTFFFKKNFCSIRKMSDQFCFFVVELEK